MNMTHINLVAVLLLATVTVLFAKEPETLSAVGGTENR